MVTQVTRVPKPYWFGSLPDHALMQELGVAVRHERGATARLLALLAEVDERRLHTPAGYASLYLYCVGALHMSEGSAYKRIRAARLARRFPAIFDMVADGRLHLSALVLLSTHLEPGNADELLAMATHRSKTELEALLARRFPQPDITTWITPLAPVAAQLSPGTVGFAGELSDFAAPSALDQLAAPVATPSAPCAPVTTTPPPAVAPAPAPSAPFPRLAPLSPERYALQVTLSRETHAKLRRAQELLGSAASAQCIAQVLDRALALLVAQLEKRHCGASESPRPRRSHANGRYVPAEVRREVFERDGQQCTFVSSNGHRCEARSKLELDHVIPLARGGRTEAGNLRLLCKSHNQLAAEQAFGAGFMREYREAGLAHRASPNSTRLRDARG